MNSVFHKLLITAFLYLASLGVHAQSPIALNGKIVEKGSNEPMIGVTVYSQSHPDIGTMTDIDGDFSLSLPSGKHTLVSSYVGFVTLYTDVVLSRNQQNKITLEMEEDTQLLQEVVVTSTNLTDRLASTQIGVERIEIKEMARVPALFGERDIIRSIQLLPGIKSESDGSSGFQVRGGTASQNHILLDDATVYNAGHLMGIFSTFNDDALFNASLYKGLIPAQFGGGSSSVFDIMTKNGDMEKFNVSGSIGLLAAKASVEGPIAKDKASFFFSMRRTYFDAFLQLSDRFKDNKLNFYDVNTKLNYNISDKNKLFLSLFSGLDNMGLDDMFDMQWGNQTGNIRWFHQFNNNHYVNTSAWMSSYSSSNGIDVLNQNRNFDGYIRHTGLKQSYDLSINDKVELKYGVQTVYTDLKTAEWNFNSFDEKERRSAWENTAWINSEWKANDKLSLLAGMRFNLFSALGGVPYYKLDASGNIQETLNYKKGEFVKSYFTPEPRISLNYRVNSHSSVKAGYSRTSQHIRALNNGSMSLPFNRYAMSSNIVKPELSGQSSLGYVTLIDDNMYEFSIEGYYKTLQNVLDYKDGKSFSSDIEIEKLILAGQGRSYGLEFYAKKNKGRLNGWLSYTLSWSENKIPGINNNEWYTAPNDRRHDLSIVGMYKLSDKWDLAATWLYNTGQALTAPSAKYDLNGEVVYYFSERNGYRAPDYHRLDVSATYTKRSKKFEQEWVFGLYNAYNQYNPFIISFENDKSKPTGTKAVQRSLFGIIPSVSYNFKF